MAAAIAVATACGGGEKVSPYPIEPTDELVAAGQPIYVGACAACHGDTLLPPPVAAAPPHTGEGHTWHHADRLLVEWILDGVPLATVMPRFNGQLTEEEVRSIVAFIKTMWSEEQREFQLKGSLQYEEQVRELATEK